MTSYHPLIPDRRKDVEVVSSRVNAIHTTATRRSMEIIEA